MASTNTTTPDTETITESNIDDIVKTLEKDGEVIGYACQQLLENNAVEQTDLTFFMDMMTPKASGNTNTTATTPQEQAVKASQEFLITKMTRKYGIDPYVSQGIRCLELPVDGSTYFVRMTIETNQFKNVTTFDGCRQLEWDRETHDCYLYEAHLLGSYIGAINTDKDGVMFSDAVGALEKLIEGPLSVELSQQLGSGLLGPSNFETAFVGVAQETGDPNFQGADQGRDVLKEPTNLKTGVESNYNQRSNRKTITVVGGLLVACFSIAFALVGYILYNRRRSYRKNISTEDEEEGVVGNMVENLDYEMEPGNTHDDYDDDEDQHDDEHYDEPHPQEDEEYPDLPMSAEAIQMDLGNALKRQTMGAPPPSNSSRLFSPERGDEHDLDESDSWAQTDGTIGSLELQLEPITAEV